MHITHLKPEHIHWREMFLSIEHVLRDKRLWLSLAVIASIVGLIIVMFLLARAAGPSDRTFYPPYII